VAGTPILQARFDFAALRRERRAKMGRWRG
jgi:hypothetical protein